MSDPSSDAAPDKVPCLNCGSPEDMHFAIYEHREWQAGVPGPRVIARICRTAIYVAYVPPDAAQPQKDAP